MADFDLNSVRVALVATDIFEREWEWLPSRQTRGCGLGLDGEMIADGATSDVG